MNVLITCHSQYEHNVKNVVGAPVNQIDYIDIGQPAGNHQYNDWSKLPNNFYDSAWSVGCPVYGLLTTGAGQQIGINVVNSAWNVLKKGGIFVIEFPPEGAGGKTLEQILEKTKRIVKSLKHKWGVELVSKADLPIQVITKYPDRTHAIILKKPSGKTIKWANNQGESLATASEIPENQGYKGRTNLFSGRSNRSEPLAWYWKLLGYEDEPTGLEGVNYYTGHAVGGKSRRRRNARRRQTRRR